MTSRPSLARRRAAERRFRLLGLGAVLLSAACVVVLVATMLIQGLPGLVETRVRLPVDAAAIRGAGDDPARLEAIVDRAAIATLGPRGAEMIADRAWSQVRGAVAGGRGMTIVEVPASYRLLNGEAAAGLPAGTLVRRFDWSFLTGTDSTDAATAGIWGALKGSLLTLAVTLCVALPVGVLAALYLEEFAPQNRVTDGIEVSINNLAAVPSILFGLLGLALFLGTMGLPRSAPLVAGLTLALMTMPVIVITARSALRSVSPSIREAALAVGASPIQVTFHHVVPRAMPGILTGAIIGLARALGETAPLLLIGMRAFVAAPPRTLTDPATVLPVQIFLWSDRVDRGFVEKTSAAILVLLAVLLVVNGAAVWLRDRYERSR